MQSLVVSTGKQFMLIKNMIAIAKAEIIENGVEDDDDKEILENDIELIHTGAPGKNTRMIFVFALLIVIIALVIFLLQ